MTVHLDVVEAETEEKTGAKKDVEDVVAPHTQMGNLLIANTVQLKGRLAITVAEMITFGRCALRNHPKTQDTQKPRGLHSPEATKSLAMR